MRHRDIADVGRVLREQAARESERFEQKIVNRGFIAAAVDDLDHAAGDGERCVVVGKGGSDGGQLRQLADILDIAGERAIVGPCAVVVIPEPACGMVQHLPHGDIRRARRNEILDVEAHRPVEIQSPGVDKAHRGRSRIRLAVRCEAEHGRGVDGRGLADIGDAEAAQVFTAAIDDAKRAAGNRKVLHPFRDLVVELCEQRVGVLVLLGVSRLGNERHWQRSRCGERAQQRRRDDLDCS